MNRSATAQRLQLRLRRNPSYALVEYGKRTTSPSSGDCVLLPASGSRHETNRAIHRSQHPLKRERPTGTERKIAHRECGWKDGDRSAAMLIQGLDHSWRSSYEENWLGKKQRSSNAVSGQFPCSGLPIQ